MFSTARITPPIFLVAVATAAVGGAGLDRYIVSLRAELVCPDPTPPAPVAHHHEATIAKQPFLPIPASRSW